MQRKVARDLVCGLLMLLFLPATASSDMPKAKPPGLEDRCPICGMFVYKYPDWIAQIHFKTNETAFFDGAKDLFKYYFSVGKYHPGRSPADIIAIYVTDYYSLTSVDAARAFYVVGSDVYGPMGRELIPFSSAADAGEFLTDHRGKKIIEFEAITPDLLHSLD